MAGYVGALIADWVEPCGNPFVLHFKSFCYFGCTKYAVESDVRVRIGKKALAIKGLIFIRLYDFTLYM